MTAPTPPDRPDLRAEAFEAALTALNAYWRIAKWSVRNTEEYVAVAVDAVLSVPGLQRAPEELALIEAAKAYAAARPPRQVHRLRQAALAFGRAVK